MSSSRIKDFVRHAFLQLKLALAFHVIINTPPGKTAEEYARELQNSLIKVLHDNNDPRLLKRLAGTLKQQKETGANEVSSIVAIPNGKDLSECLPNILSTGTSLEEGQDSGYGSCDIVNGDVSQIVSDEDLRISSAFAAYKTPLDFSEDVRKTLSANLDFVQGLIRLQDLVEKGDEVLGDISSPPRPSNRVLGGVIQYALQSSNVEATVKNSVREILRHLCGVALVGTDLPYAISNWEGSLEQHSIAIIRKLSDDKLYQQAIVQAIGGVATILITDILQNYNLEKNMKHEYQVMLLLQLCGSIQTCIEVLNILINSINKIASTSVVMDQSESTSTPIEQTINFEHYFFCFLLTEKLLTRCFALQQANESLNVNLNNSSKEIEITELWRGAWDKKDRSETPQNVPGQESSDSRKLLQSWYADLQKAAQVFADNYPLLTTSVNNCLKLITDCLQKDQSKE